MPSRRSDPASSGLIPFFAGVDTVGQTLVFAIYELLRHPELLTRVGAEVDHLFADGLPGRERLRNAVDLRGDGDAATLPRRPRAAASVLS